MAKTSKSKKRPKKVVVDRAFLLGLADSIYNPKTKQFLRLCNGKLQNGPDPTDESRPMHCGLGELYFAMTGRQPEDDDFLDEEGVIDVAVDLSELAKEKNAAVKKVIAGVKALKLPRSLQEIILEEIDSESDDGGSFDGNIDGFREALEAIPNINDDGNDSCGTDAVSNAVYRARAKRVAYQLRKAARTLPR